MYKREGKQLMMLLKLVDTGRQSSSGRGAVQPVGQGFLL